jgi:exodeoxyribonuclease V gamma subunit
MLVHGNQPEMLRDLVVEWMKRYPLAPLENEIILVQSNGIAQWLKLALAADAGRGRGQRGLRHRRGAGNFVAVALSVAGLSRGARAAGGAGEPRRSTSRGCSGA